MTSKLDDSLDTEGGHKNPPRLSAPQLKNNNNMDTDGSLSEESEEESALNLTMKKDLSVSDSGFHCPAPKCKLFFKSQWRLECHTQCHTKGPYVCKYLECNKIYVDCRSFKNHHVKHEISEIPRTPKKRIRLDEKRLNCPIEGCTATFVRKWRLESHIAIHEGRRPYKCDYPGCDKEYANMPHLKRHAAKHNSEKSTSYTYYPCTYPECYEVLKTRQNLKKHVQRKHTKKQFACDKCPESFSKEVSLSFHAFKFHGGPPYFKCSFCPDKGFTHRREYNRHMRIHQLHLCPVQGCMEVLSDYLLLRKHIAAIHPPEYICNYCDRGIRNKERFIIHIQRHLDAFEGKIPYRKQSVPIIPHVCDICSSTFTTKASLNRHKLKIHRPEDLPVPEKLKKEPKARSDTGTLKMCQASRMAGLIVPPSINKALIENG